MSQTLRHTVTETVTITSGGTDSTAVDMSGHATARFQTPSALTGSAFTFKTSADGTTFVVAKDASGSPLSVTVAASGGYAVPAEVCAAKYFKIVSGSNEAADRSIVVTKKS